MRHRPRGPDPRFRKRCRGAKPRRACRAARFGVGLLGAWPWRGTRGYERRGRLLTFASRSGGRKTGKPPKRMAGSAEAILGATSAARTSASPRNPTRVRPAPVKATWPQGWIRTAGDRSLALEGRFGGRQPEPSIEGPPAREAPLLFVSRPPHFRSSRVLGMALPARNGVPRYFGRILTSARRPESRARSGEARIHKLVHTGCEELLRYPA